MEPTTLTIIISAALMVSEALSLIPGVASNGIFQVIWRLLKLMAGAPTKKEV